MLQNPFSDDLDPFQDSSGSPNGSPSAGKNSAAEQGRDVPMGWKPTPTEPVPVVRCTATKRDGTRCAKWSLRGTTVCLSHGAQLPNVREHAQAVVEAARMRMIGMVDDALDTIEDLATNASQDAVKLKAATEILDRAGLKGAPDLAVVVEHTQSAADIIAERLAGMAKRIEADKQRQLTDLGELPEEEGDEVPVDGLTDVAYS